jgi:hypothetical protein
MLGGELNLFNVVFSINTFIYFAVFIILGFNIVSMFLLVKLYAYIHNFLPRRTVDWCSRLKEDLFILFGALSTIVGIVLSISAVTIWSHSGFGPLVPEMMVRRTIPAIVLIAVGAQSMFIGFIMSIVKVKSRK